MYEKDSESVAETSPDLLLSCKRALGIVAIKRKISKVLGKPLTRAERRMNLGKWLGIK